jgi:hypothetical protein
MRERLMPGLKVNISETANQTLLTLIESSGETIQEILDRAIENYRRYLFLVQGNEAFVALRQNKALSEEEVGERQAWEQTLADGVEK